jgi:hypothetical protein
VPFPAPCCRHGRRCEPSCERLHSQERTVKVDAGEVAERRLNMPGGTVHVRIGTAGMEHLSTWQSEVPPAWTEYRDLSYGYGRLSLFDSGELQFEFVRTGHGVSHWHHRKGDIVVVQQPMRVVGPRQARLGTVDSFRLHIASKGGAASLTGALRGTLIAGADIAQHGLAKAGGVVLTVVSITVWLFVATRSCCPKQRRGKRSLSTIAEAL